MALDALAAAAIGVEPDDKAELNNIRTSLVELKNSSKLPDEARFLASEAANLINEVINGKKEDSSETLANVGQIISSLQMLIDPDEVDFSEGETPVSGSEPQAEESTTPPESTEKDDEPEEAAAPEPDIEADSFEDDPELIAEFITEAMDHLQNSEAALLTLETDPEDEDSLNLVFRAFHTIKGTAGFLNLKSVQTLAHRAENLLDRARKGELQLVGGYADLALESADMLKQMTIDLEAKTEKGPLPDPENLDDLIKRLENPEDYGVSDTDSIAAEDVPRVGDILVAQKTVTRRQVEKVAKERGEKPIGEAIVESGAATTTDVAKALRVQKKMGGGKIADSSIRVSTKRLDGLINMVGELVISQAMVEQNEWIIAQKDRSVAKNVAQMGKITRDLQDLSMSLRMVPLKHLFQKMVRLVRDLARKSGKQVNFVTEGEDTEIDRNMVELLGDPLIHMIRNAVDHGIESPEDRKAKGKNPVGTVTLRAYHTAGNVVIELLDDGKGLDRDKILKKAVENGLVPENKELSDSEVFKLIFAAGLSTAEKVTDVSGRGVGMDVVRKNIEAIRGRVDVDSQIGKGSTFALKIPLTLAIIDGMLLRVGDEKYIISTLNVVRAFRPEKDALNTVTNRGEMVMLRGDLLPIYRLHELFNVPDAIEEPTEALLLVVEHEGQSCALLADELLGQQQVVIKTLGDGIKKVDGVSGAAILGDGHVGLILDVAGVMNIAHT
ncbi:chemotaxis protein CheA [bacterium]|nr:chemotaxis protein CheA [bacterium]